MKRTARLLTAAALICSALAVTPSVAAEPTGMAAADGLYWRLERDDAHAGYLLGTIHSEDPRVLDYTETFLDQLGECPVFAMELVPDLPTLRKLEAVMRLPENETLADHVGADRVNAAVAALGRYGVPEDRVRRMKPWAVMMTLSMPPPTTGLFMDFALSLRAAGGGKKVIGLETLEEQVGFLENMSAAQQLELLDLALVEVAEVERVHAELVEVYLGGRLDGLEKAATEQMGELDAQTLEYFLSEGIDARNLRMRDALVERLAAGEGCVFTAVGALHLPGEKGLLRLLQASGFGLKPAPWPFAEPEAPSP